MPFIQEMNIGRHSGESTEKLSDRSVRPNRRINIVRPVSRPVQEILHLEILPTFSFQMVFMPVDPIDTFTGQPGYGFGKKGKNLHQQEARPSQKSYAHIIIEGIPMVNHNNRPPSRPEHPVNLVYDRGHSG